MPDMSAKRSLDRMPEVFVSDKSITREVSREVKAGRLRKLSSRLYTRNMADPPESRATCGRSSPVIFRAR